MAISAVELFVKFSIGIGIITDVRYPSCVGGHDLETNNDTNGQEEQQQRRIEIFPLFFFLIDILDVILDIIFSFNLYLDGKKHT